MLSHTWSFQTLGITVGIQSDDSELLHLVKANWGAMARPAQRTDLVYAISQSETIPGILISRDDETHVQCADSCEFIYALEKDITMELQRRRADLFFVHAAATEVGGSACLLVAESGQGKSTMTWALLHHGWGYLSDELAPIDLSAMRVHSYPHAVCLKSWPSPPYGLPSGTVATSHTLHVPTGSMPRVTSGDSCPLAAMFFLEYTPAAVAPAIRAITSGEASARLYANALNQLAHANAGLEAAVRVAQRVPSFMLETAGLEETCALINSTLDDVAFANSSGP